METGNPRQERAVRICSWFMLILSMLLAALIVLWDSMLAQDGRFREALIKIGSTDKLPGFTRLLMGSHGLTIIVIGLAVLGLVKELFVKRPIVNLVMNGILLMLMVVLEHVYLLGVSLPGWGILLNQK
jgi:hypothetical protein